MNNSDKHKDKYIFFRNLQKILEIIKNDIMYEFFIIFTVDFWWSENRKTI